MSAKQYIAAVLVSCWVEGKRVDIPAGEPVPPLSKHDTEQLLRMKAIRDPEAEAAQAKAADKAEVAAGADFAAAKAAVQAADASIKPDAAPATGGKKAKA